MRSLFLGVCTYAVLFFSCKSENQKQLEKSRAFLDSMISDRTVDSIMNERLTDIGYDTIGVAEGPVKVLSSAIVEQEYSNFKNVQLTYENVSSKKIDAIKFSWYGVDAFGDPADLGSSVVDGFGHGFTDDPLSPGKLRSSTWDILSSRGKKILHAWPTEVVFSDGTKWKSR